MPKEACVEDRRARSQVTEPIPGCEFEKDNNKLNLLMNLS
uniref:Uncharacterized protein n=1 Tax=Arundo donax TaxID=35708 RepID=A0A0A9A493_ARUDO